MLVNLINAPGCFEVAVCEKRKIAETDKDLLELNAATPPQKNDTKRLCLCVYAAAAVASHCVCLCVCMFWQVPTITTLSAADMKELA